MSPAGMIPPHGMLWLSRIDGQAELAVLGNGGVISLVFASISAAIAVSVWANWRPHPFLVVAILLNLGYWVIGQSFGGIIYSGNATDPNAAPAFVLLALVMYSLAPAWRPIASRVVRPGVLGTGLVAAVALAVLGTSWGLSATAPAPTTQPVAYGSPFDGLAISPPAPAPLVSLRNYRGDQITLSDYQARGDTVLVTFLSTNCPAVCPGIASELHQAVAAIPADERNRVRIVAISTDPSHDTRARVSAFLRRYGLAGDAQYLTGSPAQLRPVWREWGLPTTRGGVDLSAANTVVYGIAPSGSVMTRYSAFFTPQEIVHDVNRLASL
jgi:protein SCO1/2